MAPVFFFRISCQIFEVGRGNTHSIWENIGGGLSPLSTEQQGQIDWSNFEGIIVDSLEAKEAISRWVCFYLSNSVIKLHNL
jgi:hypothetical protein